MSAKKKDEYSLAQAIKGFISKNKLQSGIDKVEVRQAWESVLGPGVNNYTTGVEFRDGTLYVSLSSSVLREELSLGRSKIIGLLNESLGRELITKLILR